METFFKRVIKVIIEPDDEVEQHLTINVPLPIEKTKKIIRKCTDEDFDLPIE